MHVTVLGAGPTGLGAAWHLIHEGYGVTVVEASTTVGGLARTVSVHGRKADLGPHLLSTSDVRTVQLVERLLEDRYEVVARRTTVLTRCGRLQYPFNPLEVLRKMGARKASQSALHALLLSAGPRESGPDARSSIVRRYGRPAFELLFADYVAKMYGLAAECIDASFISSLIGTQRTGSIFSAIISMAKGAITGQPSDHIVRPFGGIGDLSEQLATDIIAGGGRILLGTAARRIIWEGDRLVGVDLGSTVLETNGVISTIPMRVLVTKLIRAPDPIALLATELRFRSALVVFLLIDGPFILDEQWQFINLPEFNICRIAAYPNSTSSDHRPGDKLISVEIWCSENDAVWHFPTEDVIDLVTSEMKELGLFPVACSLVGVQVERVTHAFPILSIGTPDRLTAIERHISSLEGVFVAGRTGAFNNSGTIDAIFQGMATARKVTSSLNA